MYSFRLRVCFVYEVDNLLISMSTEIIKLNSFKSNLQGLFNGLLAKFKSNNQYDITLVIQPNSQDSTSNQSID